ncbi:MAG: restriction endonuclease subunit S [Gallionella sp.]
MKNQSIEAYRRAETLLLDTLGMANFSARHSRAGGSPDSQKAPPHSGKQNQNALSITPLDSRLRGNDGVVVNIKSFKDSFAATGRLDAEYYQPKYEQVMAHITAQAHDTLSALVTIKKSIEPGSDEYSDDEQGLPFMRVADYSKFGVTPPQKKIKVSFVAENKDKLDELMPKAGTILFSKDGSVGEAYCLREDADFITSGAVLHLTVRDTKKLLPDYLTLALNSKLVKMQAERDAGGSIILHWRVGEIENVAVPLVDMSTQQKIAALVQESFSLKAESEHLLTVAKRAVEMAIEQDEAAAMAYLDTCAGMVTAPTKGKARSLSDFDPASMLQKKK